MSCTLRQGVIDEWTEIVLEGGCPLLLFVVKDKALLGKGAFGVFSTRKNAQGFLEQFEEETGHICQIEECPVEGECGPQGRVFAVHPYESLYDVFIFDGLYGEERQAADAAGYKGLIIEFQIDSPGNKRITANT
jgi:hypothetical protein